MNPILYTSTTSNAAINAFACPTAVAANRLRQRQSLHHHGSSRCVPRNLKQDVFLGKLDYQLNQTNHLSAVFNWQNWQEPNGYNTAATVNNGGVTQNGPGGTHERFFIGNWTSTFSANKVNEVRFQWGRDFEFDGTNSGGPSAFYQQHRIVRRDLRPSAPGFSGRAPQLKLPTISRGQRALIR